MKTILKTTYPCLIKTNSDECELNENDTLEIENEQFLFVYPQDGNIPFYIDLKSENENRFFSIIKYDNKKMFLLEKISTFQVESKESFSVSGQNCNIIISEHTISFETKEKNIKVLCQHTTNNFSSFKHKKYVCLQFDCDFYAFNIEKNKLFHFVGSDIKFENGVLSLIKKFHDSTNREKHCIYNLGDEISVEKQTFIADTPKTNDDLISYHFMESIKAKDYAFATSQLAENLKEKIDETSLKSFFGNIKSFLPLNLNEFISITSSEKNYVKFEIYNDKIVDISVDKL